ncbi:hypothetical protein LY78DRAFT_89006 [Colletotrichum sublineola]|nr:hypothetical protein LY78DRAFT_89006 [Colletotrichum sublineola]
MGISTIRFLMFWVGDSAPSTLISVLLGWFQTRLATLRQHVRPWSNHGPIQVYVWKKKEASQTFIQNRHSFNYLHLNQLDGASSSNKRSTSGYFSPSK